MHIIRTTHLKFFGHIARSDPFMDHIQGLCCPFTKGLERPIGPTVLVLLRFCCCHVGSISIRFSMKNRDLGFVGFGFQSGDAGV